MSSAVCVSLETDGAVIKRDGTWDVLWMTRFWRVDMETEATRRDAWQGGEFELIARGQAIPGWWHHRSGAKWQHGSNASRGICIDR